MLKGRLFLGLERDACQVSIIAAAGKAKYAHVSWHVLTKKGEKKAFSSVDRTFLKKDVFWSVLYWYWKYSQILIFSTLHSNEALLHENTIDLNSIFSSLFPATCTNNFFSVFAQADTLQGLEVDAETNTELWVSIVSHLKRQFSRTGFLHSELNSKWDC